MRSCARVLRSTSGVRESRSVLTGRNLTVEGTEDGLDPGGFCAAKMFPIGREVLGTKSRDNRRRFPPRIDDLEVGIGGICSHRPVDAKCEARFAWRYVHIEGVRRG